VDTQIVFTDDPTAIDPSIKLGYNTKLIVGVPVYTVYLASESAIQV
jgi:hypothetical protein